MVRSLFSIILLFIVQAMLIPMTAASGFPQQEDTPIIASPFIIGDKSVEGDITISDPDLSRLTDKWKVLSVEVDGEHGPAQIGQQVGDIISIGVKGNSFQFG